MPLPLEVTAGAVCAVFIGVHVAAPKLKILKRIPRSRWLSAAGGTSVAYMFLHVLPELGEYQNILMQSDAGYLPISRQLVFIVALFGLIVYYGLERLAKQSRMESRRESGEDEMSPAVYWLHLTAFGIYNFIVSYLLLHREEQSLAGFWVYAFAMSLHFLVIDHSLHDHHRADYKGSGRWILTGAIAAGYFCGIYTQISPEMIALLFAFLAGGVILNVLKEELPEERESRFSAFAFGAAAYSVLLLLV